MQTSLNYLFSGFKEEEIVLTVQNQEMNESSISDATQDDSIMFNTLCSLPLEPALQRMASSTHLNDMTSINRHPIVTDLPPSRLLFTVVPTRLRMNPRDSESSVRRLKIANNGRMAQTFEVMAEVEHLFEIRPSSGVIRPGESIQVTVRLVRRNTSNGEQLVHVYMENEKIDVLIDVCPDNDGLSMIGSGRR